MKAFKPKAFKPDALPLLIGSMPMSDHKAATQLVFDYCPDIPLWVQLPQYPEEGMIRQFLPGLPGFTEESEKDVLNTTKPDFDQEMLSFFEDYIKAGESPDTLENSSRFALLGKRGQGFAEFLKKADESQKPFAALKGQVTGPITFCTAVKDEQGKDIFYNDQLRDVAIKKLAMNARWQTRAFSKRKALPIIFLDEPVLAGFGTSGYITITKQDVKNSIEEITREIHIEGGLAGVHVCANTEWDILLTADIDIISFDAYSYFDRFILYPEDLKNYINQGKLLAWGIVPTANASIIAEQNTDKLAHMLHGQLDELSSKTGIDKQKILSQIFITPSCGTGSLDLDSAIKVLELTRDLSELFRRT